MTNDAVAAAPSDDWIIDDTAIGGSTYGIEFTIHDPAEGVFTAVKSDGSVAFGIEDGTTIFWIEMIFGADSWDVGNVYFGNIDRDAGLMNGIIIETDGAISLFTGEED